MEEVNQNLPPKNQRSKVPTRPPPIRNCLNFPFPSEKRQFFSKPLGNIKRSKAPTQCPPQKWRSRTPSENLFHRGGVDIKWNGPMLVVQTVAWFLYWLAIKSVTIFIKCFFPILLCFILSCLDISESKPSVWNLLFVKFYEQVIDWTMKEIVNKALNA